MLDEQLRKFRAAHTYKRHNVGEVDWEYIVCGQGEQALLLLPGAHGLGEVAFQLIMRFEHAYRIISPSYPSRIRTVAGLVEGLVDILTAKNIAQVYVVGGSFHAVGISGPVARRVTLASAH